MKLILNDTSHDLFKQEKVCELIDVRDLEVKPCYGCGNCTYTDRCILNDEMQNLLCKIAKCQKLIFVIEPYLGSYSIQCKRILDRIAVLGDRLYTVEKGELRKRGFRTKMKEIQFIVIDNITHEEYQIFEKLIEELRLILGMPIYLERMKLYE